jgi:ADP-ribosyl-[dinitrogen reductase] hydrolase
MWGAVIGDIVGSAYESKPIKTKAFEPLFHPQAGFTDDTLCTVALADCLMNGGNPADYLRHWGNKYPLLPYGRRFGRWLRSPEAGPYQSFGNGAAMRVSPAPILAATLDEALTLSDRITSPTHDHPEGLKGARAVTEAIWLAFKGRAPENIRNRITEHYGYDLSRSVSDIRPDYSFDETCQGTVPQALTCALDATDFEDALRNAVSLGGDSDTLACITGAIAEARFGCPDMIEQARRILPDEMTAVIDVMYDTSGAQLKS